ncbi:MAG: PLDc N-terminal domain-containing protein [Deltaproteobacteria bacterium]|nr:PLDc N-terminal domain-containing protein [Deltaproteobacteria bacterium]
MPLAMPVATPLAVLMAASWWADHTAVALEVAFVAYAIAISTVVVLERRRPTTTLALVLALVFVPVLGLLAYMLLSRSVRRRRKVRQRRIVRPIEALRGVATVAAQPDELPPLPRGLVRLAIATAAAPVRRAVDVRVLSDPEGIFAAMRAAIDGAESFIHLLFYIWHDDDTGRDLVMRLAARARAGVRVRVLVDDMGSVGVGARHFGPLLEAGGEVARFGKLRLGWRPWRSRLNFRNHRKIVVVDGRCGFIGGVNVGDEYAGQLDDRRWRDLMVEVRGDAVLGLDAVFLEDWLSSTGQVLDTHGQLPQELRDLDARRPRRRGPRTGGERERERRLRAGDPFQALPPRPPTRQGALMQVIPSGPDAPNDEAIATQVVASIAIATARVWIVTPYFVPDDPLLLAIRTAALRGVDVRVLVPTPAANDSRLVAFAASSYYDELLESGARVFEYHGGMLHAKYALFDDVALVGSANMDVRSFHLNYGVIAMFYDAEVTRALGIRFIEDLTAAREVTLAMRETRRWWQRVGEGAARVVSPLL